MLRGGSVTLPPSLLALLVAFQPCFTQPTFRTFCALAGGFLAQTRRRTVCGMLTGAAWPALVAPSGASVLLPGAVVAR